MTEFEADTRSIHCTSDAAALQCVTQIEGGQCVEATVLGCDVSDMADVVAAEAACVRVKEALCEAAVRCGESASQEECLASSEAASLDCTSAMGWTYLLEDCIVDLAATPCTAVEAPASCESVIRIGS